ADTECRPIRMPLKGRRVLRCTHCTHNLSKLEYSPSSIVFKIQYFARTYVPEIRLWQETKLGVGGVSSVFISVVNESVAKADVTLIYVQLANASLLQVVILANNDESCLECETPVVEFTLPAHDENSDQSSHSISSMTPGDDTIVLRKRNRVGLKLNVKVVENREVNILSLILKWKNELTSMTSDKGKDWRETRVKVVLGKS
ncbi:hypothetical protein PENTCL1PPCAC_18049, partial [Pristionchus entomophagus]